MSEGELIEIENRTSEIERIYDDAYRIRELVGYVRRLIEIVRQSKVNPSPK